MFGNATKNLAGLGSRSSGLKPTYAPKAKESLTSTPSINPALKGLAFSSKKSPRKLG